MELYEQLQPGWEQQAMAGTATPQQMAQKSQQQMMIDALRGGLGQQQPIQHAGNVVAASGGLNQGLNAGAIGGALGKMFSGGNPAPADLAGTSFI